MTTRVARWLRRRATPLVTILGLPTLGLVAAHLLVGRLREHYPAILDDAYISMRYGRNLAHGDGLVYNLGERVEGYTNFLWTAWMALGFVVGADPFAWVKVSSAVLALATAPLLFLLGRLTLAPRQVLGAAGSSAARAERSPSDPWLAAVPALLYLATPILALTTSDGLETPLFTFLLVLAAVLFFHERVWPASALTLAALTLTRPDGVVFAPLFFAIALWQRRPRAYLAAFAAIFILIIGGYTAARFAYYGYPVPNTFYAKAATGEPGLWMQRGLPKWLEFFRGSGGWWWLAAVPALLARRTRTVGLTLAGIIGGRIAFHFWSGGPYMGELRFLVPALPFLYLLVALSAAAWIPSRPARPVVTALVGLAMILPAVRAYPAQSLRLWRYGRELNHCHVPLGMAIRDYTAPTAVIAMIDAGAIPYFSEREAIDLLGLNDEHIAHLSGSFTHKIDLPYILGRRPDLVILASESRHFPQAGQFKTPVEGALFGSPEFQRGFVYAGRWKFNPHYWLHVYRRLDSVAVLPSFGEGAPAEPAKRRRPNRG